MALRQRIVQDIARWSDNTFAAGQMVTFTLEGEGAYTSTELVFPKQVQVVVDIDGTFEATLWCNDDGATATLWRCNLPNGEVVKFELPYGTGTAVNIRDLLLAKTAGLAVLDDTAWASLKAAVAEYSLYRPLLSYAAFVPVPASITQVPPVGAYGVEYTDYGLAFTLDEVMTAAAGDQGWAFVNGSLYLTPAPATTTPINIVWRLSHQPNELTRAFPTVPAEDMAIVGWLVEAIEAEATNSAVEMGLSGYTIGGTSVKWAQTGGSGGPSTASRSERLRSRAIAALGSPIAEWG